MQSAWTTMTWPISLTWRFCIIFQTSRFVFKVLCSSQGYPISKNLVSKPKNLLYQICFSYMLICGFSMFLSYILTHEVRFYHARIERSNFKRDFFQKLWTLRYELIRGTILWYTHTYGINISVDFSLNLVHFCKLFIISMRFYNQHIVKLSSVRDNEILHDLSINGGT